MKSMQIYITHYPKEAMDLFIHEPHRKASKKCQLPKQLDAPCTGTRFSSSTQCLTEQHFKQHLENRGSNFPHSNTQKY